MERGSRAEIGWLTRSTASANFAERGQSAGRRFSGWLTAAVLLIVGAEGLQAWGEPTASLVTVVTVERGVLDETVEATGTVTAEKQASLSARTEGLVVTVPVDAGSRVEKGDLLLELDAALAKLSLERSRAALREAQVGLEERRRLFEEGRKLAATGGIPKTEAEARQAALAQQEGATFQIALEVRERVEIVDRHRLLAPFPGVVSEKLTEVGEWVSTGVAVLNLVEVDAVRFDARLPQERFASLPLEASVRVELDSLPGQDFPAKILAKVPVKDPVSRTFLVRMAVEAPANVLAPGVSGRAIFQIRKSADTLIVPRDALVRQPDGSTMVWAVAEGGSGLKAVARPVKIGESMADRVQVLAGLEEGERIVLRGNESLREGEALDIPAQPAVK
ncbi:MAG: efflux RND transporter periplasmic adaptor subunit [Chthoniobacterales bacterium]